VLLFLVSRLSRWWRERPELKPWMGSPRVWRAGSVAAAAAVAVGGLVDQLPRAPGLEKQTRIAKRIAADRELGELIEGRLPRGAMVFQLPVMMFPEVGPRGQLGDYEHFRPYLATDSLRFSYGSLKGRSRGRWQREAEMLPTDELVRRLERYGFAALYFNKRGFADRGEKLLTELTAMGRTQRIEGRQGDQVAVLLEPVAKPKLPLARSLTFGQGWHNAPPGEARWAYGAAMFSYYNPAPQPVTADLRLVVSGAGERRLTLRVNDEEKAVAAIDEKRKEIRLRVTLRAGFNRVDLDSLEPASRLSQERGQLRTFAVHDTAVHVESALAVAGP
jgi:hypothetical protein